MKRRNETKGSRDPSIIIHGGGERSKEEALLAQMGKQQQLRVPRLRATSSTRRQGTLANPVAEELWLLVHDRLLIHLAGNLGGRRKVNSGSILHAPR